MDRPNNYDGTFEFAFDDPCFSDRVLQIEVISGPQDEKVKAKIGDNITKRFLDLYPHQKEETSPDEEVQVLRTEQIHVSSVILASKSPFFHKLFSNGMRETDPQCRVVIKIDDSDVVALMELLHFIYGGKLSSSTEGSFVTLVDVMLLSDKLQVVSCIEHCIQSLKNLPMTPESAIIYLEIALHDLVRGDIQPLADEAKKFLATRYKDVIKFKEELCNLTLPAIEAIFNGEELKVPSEDCVYDMIIKWAQEQFPSPEERRAVLGPCITRLVRFPYMSPEKLREVLTSHDLDHDFAKDVVNEALFFKVEPRNPKWTPMGSSKEAVDMRFVKRNYSRCIYYLDLSLDQCKKLRSGESLDSGRFYLGKQPFCLQAAHRSSESSFALFLIPLDCLLSEITVCCIFAAMKKTEMDFVDVGTLERKFTDLTGWGRANLFSMPWESFIADDSPYFIDDMLRLRADMSLVE